MLKSLYSGLTEGKEDDPNDEFAQIIRKPFDFCMAYEGTGIGDGSEGYALIEEAETILSASETKRGHPEKRDDLNYFKTSGLKTSA